MIKNFMQEPRKGESKRVQRRQTAETTTATKIKRSEQQTQIEQHNLRQRIKQQHKTGQNFKKPLTYHKIHGMILPVECGGIAQLARARGPYAVSVQIQFPLL